MTKKDYELIANTMMRSHPQFGYLIAYTPSKTRTRLEQYTMTVEDLAGALANDNPRFDRERFLKACGVN